MNERVARRLSRHFIIDCDKISPLATARRGKTWQTISSDSRVNVRACCLPACVHLTTISSNGNFLSRYLLSTKSLPYDNSNIHISYSFKRIKIPLLLSIAGFEFNFESSDKFIDIRAQERRINFTPIRSKTISILSQFKSFLESPCPLRSFYPNFSRRFYAFESKYRRSNLKKAYEKDLIGPS